MKKMTHLENRKKADAEILAKLFSILSYGDKRELMGYMKCMHFSNSAFYNAKFPANELPIKIDTANGDIPY